MMSKGSYASQSFLDYATIWLHNGFMSMEAVFKALGDSARRKLLDSLYERNGQTLTELCEGHDMTRQAVTKHLGILENANLVTTVKSGREKLHYINPVPIHEIFDRWISKYQHSHLRALA